MIRIVGRKILIQQGELGAFRILLIDHKGNEVPLTEYDKFIFRARYSLESNQSIRKVSTPIKLVEGNSETIYHIIEFSQSDTLELLTGDYHYELLLDRDNQRSTVIPTSIMTIEKSLASEFPEDTVDILEDPEDESIEEDFLIIFGDDDNSDEDDLILIEEDNELDYYYSIITSTPLIGNFNAIAHKRVVNTGADNNDLIII